MAQPDRFTQIEISFRRKPILPVLRSKVETIDLACDSASIQTLTYIHFSREINGAVVGSLKVKNGATFEQPGRVSKTKLYTVNGNMATQPFTLCGGEHFLVQKGKSTVKVLNRNQPTQ